MAAVLVGRGVLQRPPLEKGNVSSPAEASSAAAAGWHGSLFLVITALCWSRPALTIWPLLWLAPLGVYGIIVSMAASLRRSFRGWRFGRTTPLGVVAAAVIAAGSCAVLVAFHWRMKPDVRHFAGFLPVSSLGGLAVAGALFAIANAACEEVIFRGIFFDALVSQWGVWCAATATSLLFGYGHLHGYPPGAPGAILAGVYGLCLSGLRFYTGGLGWPVLVHITADATIFTLLASSGVF